MPHKLLDGGKGNDRAVVGPVGGKVMTLSVFSLLAAAISLDMPPNFAAEVA